MTDELRESGLRMISQAVTFVFETDRLLAAVHTASAMLLLFFMNGCQWLGGAVVFVENTGARAIDHVQVVVGGGIVELGQLGPGASRRLTPEIKADSAIRIRYVDEGKALNCDGDVYVTANMHIRVEVEIGGGACRVVDVTAA